MKHTLRLDPHESDGSGLAFHAVHSNGGHLVHLWVRVPVGEWEAAGRPVDVEVDL